jgi:Predicted methylated DNA-protein cysteine methyltransferase
MIKAGEDSDREEFKELVFQIVRLIPKGRATNYGTIARAIGYPTLSRMVGRVLADSSSRQVPAHRVVNSQGVLSGKDAFKTPTNMQELLQKEGIEVEGNKIKNWKKVFWNPIDELNIE